MLDRLVALRQVCDFINLHTLIACAFDDVMEGDQDSVWLGIALRSGNLFVNHDTAHPGDLLHEAGHLVTIPKVLRTKACGDLNRLAVYIEENEIEVPDYTGNDRCATYWGFMAARAMGLDDFLPFEKGYREEGKALYLCCLAGIGTSMGSEFSVAAYYAGLIDSKGKDQPKIWDCLQVEQVV